MNPDLEKRVPREILEELIEEGTEAFRGILEKLFNVAMQLERSEFLGAEAYERTASRRGYRNGFKEKRIQTRVGELHLEIPQVRGLRFLSQVAGKGLPFGEGPEAGHCRDVCDGSLDEKSHRDHGAAVWVGDLGHPSLESGRDAGRRAGAVSKPGAGEYPIVYLDAHYEKVRRGGRVQDVRS